MFRDAQTNSICTKAIQAGLSTAVCLVAQYIVQQPASMMSPTAQQWQRLLTAFTHALGGFATPTPGGVLSLGLGGRPPIGRLVLLHLLDDRVLRQIHLQVAEVQARRNDIHVGHVAPSPASVAQHLLQRWVKPAQAWLQIRTPPLTFVACKQGCRIKVTWALSDLTAGQVKSGVDHQDDDIITKLMTKLADICPCLYEWIVVTPHASCSDVAFTKYQEYSS